MAKFVTLMKSFLFVCVAPGTIAGLVPWLVTRWQVQPPFFGQPSLKDLGMALILLGLVPLAESFVRFVWKGVGTPAPFIPARRLAVSGFYRYVRNPMYIGVLAVILGQALWLGEVRLLLYAGVVWLISHLFIVAYEEPMLRRNFAEQYADYHANVPRWLPRLTAWQA